MAIHSRGRRALPCRWPELYRRRCRFPPCSCPLRPSTKSFAGVRALKACRSTSGRARSTPWSARTAPASRPSSRSSPAPRRRMAATLAVHGQAVAAMDPGRSRALGIAAIYQQPSLFPDLTVAENIALALETGGPWRRVDWRGAPASAAELLARIGAAIDPDAPGRDAQHARAADRRDRQGDRRRREDRHHGRADGVADRARGRAPVPRHRAASRRTASASSTSRTGSRRSLPSPIASPCCATARRSGRPRAPRVDRARSHPADGRARAVGGLPEADDRARRGRARGRGSCRTGRPASPTCRCRSAGARSSASPASSARAARSWPRRSSG